MVSSVRSRPNHYDVLGLGTTSSNEEVHRAFVAKMSLFGAHSMDEAARFLIAYETLRDPAKRQDYDASLGLGSQAEPREWSFAITPPRWTAFMVPAPVNKKGEGGRSTEHRSEPHVTAGSSLQAGVERKPVSPAARAKPDEMSARDVPPGQMPRPKSRSDDELDALVQRIRTMGREERERPTHAESSRSDWRRAGLGLGGLILGAGIVGALAGLSVKDKVGTATAEAAPSRAHPAARHNSEAAAIAPAPTAPLTEPAAKAPISSTVLEPNVRRTASRQRPSSPKQVPQALLAESPPQGELAESTEAQSAPGAQIGEAVAADLPISRRLIAHTIERIGYPCGEVFAAAPAAGKGEGVFNISCSSGHAYQATPVHGRYRFRRVASH